jgi:RNA polymerase sigma-70 factor, ECF subfamily
METHSAVTCGFIVREAELVAECQAGNLGRFESLVSPYMQSIKLLSYSILKNSHDAEDVVQETVLKAYLHINQLRAGDSFKAWFVRIACNEARMRLRKERRHLYSSVEQEIQDKPFQPRQFVSWKNIPSGELQRDEVRNALTAALACLEDGYREVFVLRDVQHLSSAETGKILGLTEGAVNTRLHRARLQMREHLTPFFRAPRPMSMTMPLKMMLLMGKTWMRKTVNCKQVTDQISNYIDNQLTPELRAKIEEHLRLCDRCAVVVDTVRKLLYVAGDENVFSVPFDCKVNWEALKDKVAQKESELPAREQ